MTTEQEHIFSLESRIDTAFFSQPLFAPSWDLAVWLLITVAEDMLRLPPLIKCHELDLVNYLGQSNNLKYALKHALVCLGRSGLPRAFRRPPRNIRPDDYKSAARALIRGIHYQAAVAAFSSYRAGTTECVVSDTGLRFNPIASRDIRLRARNLLESMAGGADEGRTSHFMQLIQWMRDGIPEELRNHIKVSTHISNAGVRYRESAVGERLIYDLLGSAFSHSLIPREWTCSYGDQSTITAVLRAVFSIHALHALSVSAFTTHKKGGYSASGPLVTSLEELAERVSRLTESSTGPVRRILELLVYGAGNVDSPDPALQPFVSVASHALLSSPILLCSSDLERNFLTLFARIAKSEFDKTSDVFERQMIEKFAVSHARKSWKYLYNTTIPSISSVGEIDCLLFDRAGKFILLLELWWQIPPAETRELANREKLAIQKSNQAHKKLKALRSRMREVLTYAGEQYDDQWQAEAILVSESFLPSTKSDKGVPVISRACLQGLLSGPHDRLADIWRPVIEEFWVPKEGEHYLLQEAEHEISGVRFTGREIAPTTRGVVFAYLSMGKKTPLAVQEL